MNDQILQIIIQAKDMASAVMKQVGGSVDTLGSKVQNVGNQMRNFGAGMTAFLSAPLIALSGYFIKTASDAEEMENRFLATFRGLEAQAISFTNTLAQSVGRSRVDIQKGLSSFQGIALGLGMAKDEAFKFSTNLQTLAIDFASFNNLSDEEAISRFIAAISGSPEVLDQFGVNIREANLQLKLNQMGFSGSVQQAGEMQKALARLEIIKEVMGSQGALGDAVKTAESSANQTRRTRAEFNQLSADLGEQLLPVFVQVLKQSNSLITWFNGLDNSTKQAIITFAGFLVVIFPMITALGTLISFVGSVMTAFTTLSGVAAVLGISVAALTGWIFVIIGAIALLVGAGIYLWLNWNNIMNWIQGTAGSSMNWLRANWFGVLTNLLYALAGPLGWLLGAWNNNLFGMRDIANRAISDVRNIFNSISLFNSGRDAIQGFINGINNMRGDLERRVRDIAGSVTNSIRDALKIRSPSRVMMELGEYTGEGFAVGLDKTQNLVRNSSQSLASVPVNSVEGGSNTNQEINNTSNSTFNISFNFSGNFLGSERDRRSLVETLGDALENEMKRRKLISA